MEKMNVSYVYHSLIRNVVMSSMPVKWFVVNLIFWVILCLMIYIVSNIYITICFVACGVITNIVLQKAYAYDEQLFSVYLRFFIAKNYMPSTSRVSTVKEKNKF